MMKSLSWSPTNLEQFNIDPSLTLDISSKTTFENSANNSMWNQTSLENDIKSLSNHVLKIEVIQAFEAKEVEIIKHFETQQEAINNHCNQLIESIDRQRKELAVELAEQRRWELAEIDKNFSTVLKFVKEFKLEKIETEQDSLLDMVQSQKMPLEIKNCLNYNCFRKQQFCPDPIHSITQSVGSIQVRDEKTNLEDSRNIESTPLPAHLKECRLNEASWRKQDVTYILSGSVSKRPISESVGIYDDKMMQKAVSEEEVFIFYIDLKDKKLIYGIAKPAKQIPGKYSNKQIDVDWLSLVPITSQQKFDCKPEMKTIQGHKRFLEYYYELCLHHKELFKGRDAGTGNIKNPREDSPGQQYQVERLQDGIEEFKQNCLTGMMPQNYQNALHFVVISSPLEIMEEYRDYQRCDVVSKIANYVVDLNHANKPILLYFTAMGSNNISGLATLMNLEDKRCDIQWLCLMEYLPRNPLNYSSRNNFYLLSSGETFFLDYVNHMLCNVNKPPGDTSLERPNGKQERRNTDQNENTQQCQSTYKRNILDVKILQKVEGHFIIILPSNDSLSKCFKENKFICADQSSLRDIRWLKTTLTRYGASKIFLLYFTVRYSHKFNGIAQVITCSDKEIEFQWMCQEEYTPIRWDDTGNLEVQHLSKEGGKELFDEYADHLQQMQKKITKPDGSKVSSHSSMNLASSNQDRSSTEQEEENISYSHNPSQLSEDEASSKSSITLAHQSEFEDGKINFNSLFNYWIQNSFEDQCPAAVFFIIQLTSKMDFTDSLAEAKFHCHNSSVFSHVSSATFPCFLFVTIKDTSDFYGLAFMNLDSLETKKMESDKMFDIEWQCTIPMQMPIRLFQKYICKIQNFDVVQLFRNDGVDLINAYIDHVRRIEKLREQGVGLKNLLNTCYMNCILQCLARTRLTKYYGELHKTDDLLLKEFSHLIHSLNNANDNSSVNPQRLKTEIGKFSERFSSFRQQDAHEFLLCFLEELNKRMKQNCAKQESLVNVIEELFTGEMTSKVIPKCKHVLSNKQPFYSVCLPIRESWKGTFFGVSLSQCWDHFTRIETMDGENKILCKDCPDGKQMQSATLQLSVSKYPTILIINMNRFDIKRCQKLDTEVSFHLEIFFKKQKSGSEIHYSLIGFCEHSGDLKFGHYWAIVKNRENNKWYRYSDSCVSEYHLSSRSEHRSKEVSILFYEMTGRNDGSDFDDKTGSSVDKRKN